MKRTTISAALAAMLLLAPRTAGAVDPIYGVWGRDGHVKDKLEFYDCAGKLCARGVLPLPDGSPAPQILRNAARTEPNTWQGDLFNPENGKLYKGTITLESPTKLTLKGCLVAFLCQSEGWTRLSGPIKPQKTSSQEAGKPGARDGKASKPKAPDPAPEPVGNTAEEPRP